MVKNQKAGGNNKKTKNLEIATSIRESNFFFPKILKNQSDSDFDPPFEEPIISKIPSKLQNI